MRLTFLIDGQVNFGDLSIEAKNGLKLGFDYISGEVGNYYYLGVGFVCCTVFHVNISIVQGVRGGGTSSSRHGVVVDMCQGCCTWTNIHQT